MDTGYWEFGEYGPPEQVLTFKQGETGEPGPGQALVAIRAVGLNRSEFNYVQGRYIPVAEFPSCLGQEAVGEILALGPVDPAATPPCRPLEVGDRVGLLPGRVDMRAMGCYRDCGLYDQNALVPIPEDYSDAEGAGLWMGVLTMAGALELAGITPDTAEGKTVLITAGASSMGVIALKLLRAWGARSIATSRSSDKSSALSELADHVVVCAGSDELSEGVQACCGEPGFDAALDPVGEAFYPGLIDGAGIGASIVSYEMISGREPVLPIAQVMIKDLALKGYTIFRAYRVAGLLEYLVDTGLRYAADIRPIIAAEYSLGEAPAALSSLGQSGHVGKFVLNTGS